MRVVSVVSRRRRRVQTGSRPQAVPAYRWEVTTLTTRTSARRCLAEEPITPRRIWVLYTGFEDRGAGAASGACFTPDVT
jgi:hypothetical protein